MTETTIRYKWQGGEFETKVPVDWPIDAVAEVCAFRAGASPGDVFSFTADTDTDVLVLVATGTGA